MSLGIEEAVEEYKNSKIVRYVHPVITGNAYQDVLTLRKLDKKNLQHLCMDDDYIMRLCNDDPILTRIITAPTIDLS